MDFQRHVYGRWKDSGIFQYFVVHNVMRAYVLFVVLFLKQESVTGSQVETVVVYLYWDRTGGDKKHSVLLRR